MQSARCAKPEDIAARFSHDDGVRVASSYLNSFVSIHSTLLQVELPWRKLRLVSAVTELAMCIPTPSVDLAEGALGDNMSETAFDRVDTLTGIFEAANDLWDIIGVDVAKTKLSILVVFTKGIDMTLLADEEAKVVAA